MLSHVDAEYTSRVASRPDAFLSTRSASRPHLTTRRSPLTHSTATRRLHRGRSHWAWLRRDDCACADAVGVASAAALRRWHACTTIIVAVHYESLHDVFVVVLLFSRTRVRLSPGAYFTPYYIVVDELLSLVSMLTMCCRVHVACRDPITIRGTWCVSSTAFIRGRKAANNQKYTKTGPGLVDGKLNVYILFRNYYRQGAVSRDFDRFF